MDSHNPTSMNSYSGNTRNDFLDFPPSENESGLGEEPSSFIPSSFIPSVPISAAQDGVDEKYAPLVPPVNTTTQVLKPARGNDGLPVMGSNVLRQASPHSLGGSYPIQVEKKNYLPFCNETCQEIARVTRKTAIACKSRESAAYTKYIVDKVKELDNQFNRMEVKIKKLERQVKRLEMETCQKEDSLKLLKEQNSQLELDIEKRIEYFEQFHIPEPQLQLKQQSSIEKMIDDLQQKIQTLKNENSNKDTTISWLQKQQAETVQLREDKKNFFAMEEEWNKEAQILAQCVYQIVEDCHVKHFHEQVSRKSKIYAGFFKTRTPRVAEVYFGAAPHLTHNPTTYYTQQNITRK